MWKACGSTCSRASVSRTLRAAWSPVLALLRAATDLRWRQRSARARRIDDMHTPRPRRLRPHLPATCISAARHSLERSRW